ncbi:hypothetical protein O181_051541 [Austropuccinia psidii MF-1]|uniref:Uncharacterized protein n=1 Tax=Austropuccinia psidii MF-1 TaxID=1389203 RepID=A0A9Q3HNF4_9BASI|nr:hypothetical protein [Austropuccinia psidii MF-1]
MISIEDGLTVKSATELWSKITIVLASKTITNRGQASLNWEYLNFNVNIEEYIQECSKMLFDIAGIGISLPSDIITYSILENVNWDSSLYDHIIDSMVLSMNSNINPQQVLEKLSDFSYTKTQKGNLKRPQS